jgi:hypothetical protein
MGMSYGRMTPAGRRAVSMVTATVFGTLLDIGPMPHIGGRTDVGTATMATSIIPIIDTAVASTANTATLIADLR